MTEKHTPVFVLSREHTHGVGSLIAEYCHLTPDGKLRHPGFDKWNPAMQLADFEVYAYLDDPHPRVIGFGHWFRPWRVELPRAEAMVKALRRLQRGLDKANSEEGYLDHHDFPGYLFRVARILGIRTYWVENTRGQRELTGERFRQVDGAGVQGWVAAQEREIGKQPT